MQTQLQRSSSKFTFFSGMDIGNFGSNSTRVRVLRLELYTFQQPLGAFRLLTAKSARNIRPSAAFLSHYTHQLHLP